MRTRSIEWPTLAVAATIAVGLAATFRWHERLPTPVVLVVLAVLGAWYNSLQHEIVHGHPTPWPFLNGMLAAVPLALVMPFSAYRSTHVAHHRSSSLTDPAVDPESFYVSAAAWQRLGKMRRTVLVVLRTLAGRMVIGPPLLAIRWWVLAVCGPGVRGVHLTAASAVVHIAAVAAVLTLVSATGLAIWIYLVGVVWGGGALSLLRSFAEHRVPENGTRSAVVRSNWCFSLLFLNNNLHHTHHARPDLAWYALPRAHRRLGSDELAASGAGLYRGYTEVARRYLVRPFGHPVVPTDPDQPMAHRAASGVA